MSLLGKGSPPCNYTAGGGAPLRFFGNPTDLDPIAAIRLMEEILHHLRP